MTAPAGVRMRRAAALSEDGRYRYELTRGWDEDGPGVLFVMLNPSTADHRRDDPTIRRCIGFAHRWGFRRLRVANLFALRATDPGELARAADPVGPENDRWLRAAADADHLVVAAWGAHPIAAARERVVAALFAGTVLHCLGTTRSGAPRHPLYVRTTQPLSLWNFTRERADRG